ALAEGDARRAYAAARVLHADAATVRHLAEWLRPAKVADQATLRQWVADLDNDDFEKRERATHELERQGEIARALLLPATAKGASLEVVRRGEELLRKLRPHGPVGEALREARAVRILEKMGTPPARELLRRLACGDEGAALTEQAKAALRRLGD